MLSFTLRPFTSILCTYTGRATFQHGVRWMAGQTYPEVHTDGRARLVLWQPLLVRESQEQAALAHRGVSDEEQLHVHGPFILQRVARHVLRVRRQVVTENTFRVVGKEREERWEVVARGAQ